MISAIIIEEDSVELKRLTEYSERSHLINLEKTFKSPAKAIRYLHQFPVDLLILSIHHAHFSDISIRDLISKGAVIIVAADQNYLAVEAYEMGALDFLVKPISFERFESSVKRAVEYLQYLHNREGTKDYIFVRADYSKRKITNSEIQYIEALDDYLKIYLNNDSPVVIKMTMKKIQDILPKHSFIRVHRSFIVPLNKIKSVRRKRVVMEKISIPIGSSYENIIKEMLQ
jgi:DNA-binding LytR/AlgR family response regulator